MIWRVHFASFLVIILCSCEDDSVATLENTPTESTLTRRERVRELESDLEVAKWDTPFTGMALENFPDDTPRAEAYFLNGQKDGMERLWYPNGKLKEEGQWFNNRANGLMRSWDQDGKISKAVRYKNGELIEVLR